MKTTRSVCGSGASREALLRMLRLRVAAFALMPLLLASCGVLGGTEPVRILDPGARVTADAAWPRASWSLLVLRPTASQSLDTERIVVRPTPGALQVYEGAVWPDTAPDLVQTVRGVGYRLRTG